MVGFADEAAPHNYQKGNKENEEGLTIVCDNFKMEMLKEDIYYVDDAILEKIDADFELIEMKGWYSLYQNKIEKSYWRLDAWDKYQVQMFVKIESVENWTEFKNRTFEE